MRRRLGTGIVPSAATRPLTSRTAGRNINSTQSLPLASNALRSFPKYLSTSSTSSFITVEDRNRVRWVILNRPETHNAFNEVVINDITNTFAEIKANADQLRAVVLTGNGKSFSAGADLNWMKKMASYTQMENEQDAHRLFEMVNSIYSCPLPVIGRINGPALGGGSGLISACDFSFSVTKALFGFTEARLGLIPSVISPFVMMKIGRANCSRYFLTAEKFGAEEALRIGLIQGHFPTLEEVDKTLNNVLTEIENNSPAATRECKKLIHNVFLKLSGPKAGEGLAEMKYDLASEIAKIRVSPEGQEGLASFLEKRKPSWVPQTQK